MMMTLSRLGLKSLKQLTDIEDRSQAAAPRRLPPGPPER